MVLDIPHLAFSEKYSMGIYIRGKQELLIYSKMYTLQQNVISEIKVQCIYIRPDMFQLIHRSSKTLDTAAFYNIEPTHHRFDPTPLRYKGFLLKNHLEILHRYLPR
jgi:hypothetical protein